MRTPDLANISSADLHCVADIRENIESLEVELVLIPRGGDAPPAKKKAEIYPPSGE